MEFNKMNWFVHIAECDQFAYRMPFLLLSKHHQDNKWAMIARRNKNIHSYLRSRHIKYANELSKCERFLVKHMLNSSTFSFYEIQISICVLIVFETRKHQHYVKIWQHTHSLNMNLVDPLMCILYVLCEVSFLLWGLGSLLLQTWR